MSGDKDRIQDKRQNFICCLLSFQDLILNLIVSNREHLLIQTKQIDNYMSSSTILKLLIFNPETFHGNFSDPVM